MYIEGKNWYFTIYTIHKTKTKVNILKRAINDFYYLISILKKDNYKLYIKMNRNDYYTIRYKKLYYAYGYNMDAEEWW